MGLRDVRRFGWGGIMAEPVRHEFFRIARPRWEGVLSTVLAFLPVAVFGWLVATNGVNTLVWDDWERAPIIEKWESSTLTFEDLYAPHIDHRIFFPRLVSLGLHIIGVRDLRWEMALTFFTGLLAGVAFYRLLRDSFVSRKAACAIAFAANLVIFSPLAFDNWLWSIQLAMMLPGTCLLWALWCATQDWSWNRKFWACSCLALIGVHSFSHGLVILPAVFAVVALLRLETGAHRGKILFLCWWGLFSAVVIGFYFGYGYVTTSQHSYGASPGDPTPATLSMEQLISRPGKWFSFTALLLGNLPARMLSTNPMEFGMVFGIGGASLLLLFFLLLLLFRRRDTGMWNRVVPWLTLGAVILVTASGMAAGRAGFSPLPRALVTRYVSTTQYLLLADFVLILLVLDRFWPRLQTLRIMGITLFSALSLQPWIYGANMMGLWKESRLEGHSQLIFSRYFEPTYVTRLDSDLTMVKSQRENLNRLGYLDPPLLERTTLENFRLKSVPMPASKGTLISIDKAKDGGWVLQGTACLSLLPLRPAHLVLLTAGGGEAAPILSVGEPMPEFASSLFETDLEFTGQRDLGRPIKGRWKALLSEESLKKLNTTEEGSLPILAWALNLENMTVYRLSGQAFIQASGGSGIEP